MMEEAVLTYSPDTTLPKWKRIMSYDSPSKKRALIEAERIRSAYKHNPKFVGHLPEVTKGLTKLLQRFSHHPARIVKVDTFPGAIGQKCYGNVDLCIDASGGWGVLGWKVWQFNSRKINLEHHACWVMPDGTMISPTPEYPHEDEIMFLQQGELLDWIDDENIGSARYYEGLKIEENTPKERAALRRKNQKFNKKEG